MSNETANWLVALDNPPVPSFDDEVVRTSKNDVRIVSVCKTNRIDIIIVSFVNIANFFLFNRIVNNNFGVVGDSDKFFAVTRKFRVVDSKILEVAFLTYFLVF